MSCVQIKVCNETEWLMHLIMYHVCVLEYNLVIAALVALKVLVDQAFSWTCDMY